MATSGQLKAKIDLLKKKLGAQGAPIPPERRRLLGKRLKRMQRRRRVLARLEGRGKAGAGKGKPAEPGGAPGAQPAAS
jgi:hypothetical protein